jgi:hypothetical protein
MLTKLGVRSERHVAHFHRGIPDETWLPLVGSKGWILLTADKRIRYNLLEKHALEEHAVREFVFTSGNMSGQDMATALELALPKMRGLATSSTTFRLLHHPPGRSASPLAQEWIKIIWPGRTNFYFIFVEYSR